MVARAEQEVNGEEEGQDSEGGEEEEEEEEDAGSDQSAREEREEGEKEDLSTAQRACLQFCIALLDQRISQKEYDSALVCALADLRVREGD